jgi:hypothetical protein
MTKKLPWEVESVLEWMDNQIHHAEHSVGDLKRSKQRFVDSLEKRADDTAVSSIGWFVNDIQNITRNFRLDTAPDHAVRLHSYFKDTPVED